MDSRRLRDVHPTVIGLRQRAGWWIASPIDPPPAPARCAAPSIRPVLQPSRPPYSFCRLTGAIVLLWIVLTCLFFVLRLAPPDAQALLDDPRIPASQRARVREIYGDDRPLPAQYARWLGAATRWDWGFSVSRQEPVAAGGRRFHRRCCSAALAGRLAGWRGDSRCANRAAF
jgi:hypothetical protein